MNQKHVYIVLYGIVSFCVIEKDIKMFEKFYFCFVLGLCFTTCAHMVNLQNNNEIQKANLQPAQIQAAPIQYSRAESIPYEEVVISDGNRNHEELIVSEENKQHSELIVSDGDDEYEGLVAAQGEIKL